jgi:hypothetical protein
MVCAFGNLLSEFFTKIQLFASNQKISEKGVTVKDLRQIAPCQENGNLNYCWESIVANRSRRCRAFIIFKIQVTRHEMIWHCAGFHTARYQLRSKG